MKKKIKHHLLNKGRKKVSLYFTKCWLGVHYWENKRVVECDLIHENSKNGECSMTLFFCKKCGKEKLVISEIRTTYNQQFFKL